MPELSRRERKKKETYEKLFSCAMQLFRIRGYSATSVEQITQKADVGKGTFYNYFSSKEAVVQEYAQRAYQEMLSARRHKPSLNTRQRLETLLSDWAGFMMNDREIAWVTVRNREGAEYDASLHYGIQAIIALGQTEGDVSKQFGADFLAESIEGMMLQHFISWYVTGEGDLVDEMNKVVTVFLDGLSAQRQKA